MDAVDMSAVQVSSSVTEIIAPDVNTSSQPVLRLRLKKPKNDKKVGWREGTVDNEHMGKKKSKCCCIYKKPTEFGESSSEDDEECEHCFGHPEKKRKNRKDGDGHPLDQVADKDDNHPQDQIADIDYDHPLDQIADKDDDHLQDQYGDKDKDNNEIPPNNEHNDPAQSNK